MTQIIRLREQWTPAQQRAYMQQRRRDARAEGLCLVCLRRPVRYADARPCCDCEVCARAHAQRKRSH